MDSFYLGSGISRVGIVLDLGTASIDLDGAILGNEYSDHWLLLGVHHSLGSGAWGDLGWVILLCVEASTVLSAQPRSSGNSALVCR